MHVRHATCKDLPAITALLLEDAAARAAHDAKLWPEVQDAAERIASKVEADARHEVARWLVAEANGAVDGVARFGLIACPPIYAAAGSRAFILFDDTYVRPRAPADALAALIGAAEREGKAANAAISLAACAPFQRAKLSALADAGYDVVTHYLVKHDLAPAPMPDAVRIATAADVPSLVAQGARAQACLARANARMWTPHAEAPARFGFWMQLSLTLPDRRIFIAASEDQGFVIAQPTAGFHLPLATPHEHIGLIDDFWANEFAPGAPPRPERAAALLTAAEHAFVERGCASAMAICPALWPEKQAALRRHGYGDGNAWLLKA